ncbi:MAG: hypothetical protein HYY41_05405 [Chloroflexi bacterium]|nr:hypothetical protein [Chloroflexota bacterium]
MAFLAIGISIMLMLEKPKKWQGYLFLALSVLMFVLYQTTWNLSLVTTRETQSVEDSVPAIINLGQLGQILGGGIIAALLTLGGREVVTRWKRPRFEVDFTDKPIFLRERTDPGWESYWLRVRVTNSGRSVAKGCNGRITKFIDTAGNLIDRDPLTLHWIETLWEHEPYRAVDLRQGEERYLDVLVQKAKAQSQVFLFTPPLRNIDDLQEVPTGTCRVEIVIYGENAEPCPKEYQIKWDDDRRYKGVRLKEFRH